MFLPGLSSFFRCTPKLCRGSCYPLGHLLKWNKYPRQWWCGTESEPHTERCEAKKEVKIDLCVQVSILIRYYIINYTQLINKWFSLTPFALPFFFQISSLKLSHSASQPSALLSSLFFFFSFQVTWNIWPPPPAKFKCAAEKPGKVGVKYVLSLISIFLK